MVARAAQYACILIKYHNIHIELSKFNIYVQRSLNARLWYKKKNVQLFLSSLQLLSHTRWEVFCPLQSKMKFLVALLSLTLVHGAANPGHDDHGHIEYQQHDGPHCHDKKDQQCHKIPKEQEHEECYVDYEIIVDVTYIEECQYVTKTYCHEEQESSYHHSRIVGHDSRVVDEYEEHRVVIRCFL